MKFLNTNKPKNQDLLLIGNFSKPYDGECFYCNQQYSAKKNNTIIIDVGNLNFISYLINLIKRITKVKRVHIISKACIRTSLLILFFTIFIARIFNKRTEITLYPELFNFFGNFRSKLVGESMLYLIFSLACKVYYTNDYSREVILKYYSNKKKLEFKKIIINLKNLPNKLFLKKRDKNIFLFNEPSGFLLEICKDLIKINNKKKDLKIVIATKNKGSLNLKSRNIYFLEDYTIDELLEIYSKSKIIFRPLKFNNRISTPDCVIVIDIPKIKNGFLELESCVLLKKRSPSIEEINNLYKIFKKF